MSQGLGRPLIGLASDRWGRLNVAGIGTLIAGLAAFFLWIFAGSHFGGLIVYALFGGFAGIIWPCVAPVGAEVVGLQLLPSGMYPLLDLVGLVADASLPPQLYPYTGSFSFCHRHCMLPRGFCPSHTPTLNSSLALLTPNPNPSAEVIGLSLRTSGKSAYLNVQAFTGTMYIVAFFSSTSSRPLHNSSCC